MSTATFFLDTHAHIKRLTEAGVPEPQAEAHVSVQADFLRAALAEQGAKQQESTAQALNASGDRAGRAVLKLRAEMQELRTEMLGRFAKADGHLKLHNWMLGGVLGLLVAIAAKLFLG